MARLQSRGGGRRIAAAARFLLQAEALNPGKPGEASQLPPVRNPGGLRFRVAASKPAAIRIRSGSEKGPPKKLAGDEHRACYPPPLLLTSIRTTARSVPAG
jgi:hypothetical protein